MPTYRSTIPEKVIMVHQDCYGRRQVLEAVRDDGERDWDMHVTIPSGQRWDAKYSGDVGLYDAVTEFMNSKRNDFVASRDRGDKPRSAYPDRNRAVREDGTFSAPSISFYKKGG
jgi:hypothetical protein